MRPRLPRPKQHCSVKTKFGYFAGGCFTDRPALVNSPATADRQLNEQHQVQEVEDAAEDVAVGVLQKSDEIHRVDFFDYSPNLASLTTIMWLWLSSFPVNDGQPRGHKLKKPGGRWLSAIALTLLLLVATR